MDVRLSPEQHSLRDSAAQVVDRFGPKTVADLDDDERAAKLDATIEAAGWRDLRSASDGDQPLASAVEVALIAEQLGRGLADAPYLGPTLAADLRRRAGSRATGHAETVLLRSDLSGLSWLPNGDAGVFGARLPAVAIDARNATSALALCAGPQGEPIVSVPLEPANAGVDLTRTVASAAVEAAPLPVPGRHDGISKEALDAWTALGLAATCADLVGAMRGALRLACDYVSARSQYGVPVGSFQAVQHLLADAHVSTEGSSSVALHAAWAVDALAPDKALVAAAVAKAYCARAARNVCEAVIQVHGGIGNTWECVAHLYLRRALLSIDILGGVGPSLDRVLQSRGIGDGHGLR
jgi:Acyl-CoA dehydrogenase, C-terminal domain